MNLKKSGAALLCAGMLFAVDGSIAASAAETPEVIYNGKTGTLILENAEETDLFPELKEMMPGDSVTQTIRVAAQETEGTVDFYLTVKDAEPEDAAIFENVMFTVRVGNRVVSEGTLARAVTQENSTELFSFAHPGEQSLDVTLSVSENAGNELMDAAAAVLWTFTVQDYARGETVQTGGGNGNAAQTGDATDTRPWTAGVVCCAGIAAGTVILKMKRSDKTKKDA